MKEMERAWQERFKQEKSADEERYTRKMQAMRDELIVRLRAAEARARRSSEVRLRLWWPMK